MQENLVNTDTKDLIITYGMPYKPASSDRISRWIKDEQVMAGIKARDNGLVITDILK